MSFSAPHSKMPSPALTPRVSSDERPHGVGRGGDSRDAESRASSTPSTHRRVHKPAGIVNMGMTCFLNSTFQALAATPALVSLLSNNPALPLYPTPWSLLPPPSQEPGLTPCLLPDTLEPPFYPLLPVTRAFTNNLHKAWTTKERGGGTSGPGETSSMHCITIGSLLKEIARKYDQYDAFAQQDAHELLRHLLDSMEMEEKDVIKRKAAKTARPALPPPPPQPVASGESLAVPGSDGVAGGASTTTAASEGAATPTAESDPSDLSTTPTAASTSAPATDPSANASPPSPSPSRATLSSDDPNDPSSDRLLPFVDLLFGGLLASVVVCDTCKSVSHTYEGFLDLSLSMRGDEPPRNAARKRDRLRAITNRFKPRKGLDAGGGVMSEPEGSDTDGGSRRHHFGNHGHGHGHGHRKHGSGHHGGHHGSSHNANRDSDVEDNAAHNGHANGAALGTSHGASHGNSLSASIGSLGTSPGASLSRASSSAKSLKASFSFRKKSKGHGADTSPAKGTSAPTSRSAPGTPMIPSSPTLAPLSHPELSPLPPPLPQSHPPPVSPRSPLNGPAQLFPLTHAHAGAPTPAQEAYISRILNGPPVPPESSDPLAKLRAAHAGGLGTPTKQEYGLIESLRAFTGVETLEGDNAFACHKCWRIKTGRYKSREREKSADKDKAGALALPLPSIAIDETETEPPTPTQASSGASSTTGTSPEMSRLGRLMSRGQRMPRPTSPLRQLIDQNSPSEERREPEFPRSDTSSSESSTSGAVTASESTTVEPQPIADKSAESVASVASVASITSSVSGLSVSPSSCTAFPSTTSMTAASVHGDEDPGVMSPDGLSDTETSSDSEDSAPIVPRHRLFRPPARKQSKHFVLRRAFKRYLIAKAPAVLVFHIKRFRQTGNDVYHSTFSSLKKMDDPVSFPLKLDLAPFMAPNRADFKCRDGWAPYMDWPAPDRPPEPAPMPYRLYAVVVHLGTMLSGHYVAYVLVDPEKVLLAPGQEAPRDPPEAGADRRVWCYCSDTEVRLASVDEVLAARAYLCFYEAVSPPRTESKPPACATPAAATAPGAPVPAATAPTSAAPHPPAPAPAQAPVSAPGLAAASYPVPAAPSTAPAEAAAAQDRPAPEASAATAGM